MRSYRCTCTTSWMKFCPCLKNYSRKKKKKARSTTIDAKKLFHFSCRNYIRIYLTLTRIERENLERKSNSDLTIPRTTILLPKRNCLTRACNSKVMPRPSSINPLKSIESASRIQLDYRPSCNSLPFD